MGFNSGFKGLKVVGRVVGGRCQAHCAWQRPLTTRPTTFYVWKTKGCQCSFRLLMMGGVSPEACWASCKYMIWYIFNCNRVATRWQYYSTHIHTNNTENDTKQTIHRTTHKLGRVRAVPRLCCFYPGICLTTEEKARRNLSQGSHMG